MSTILETLEVSFSYPASQNMALNKLKLRIPEGKKTAICGHNGSGKSTLFLQAIGIHSPSSGQVVWKNEALTYTRKELKQLRQDVGLVFQDPEQQLILNTPYEDVTYGLRNAAIPEPEINRRAEAILRTMGLEHLANTPIHHLSLGQKKRVALAGVLVLEPKLLLLDEPTAYLDRISEQQLVEELDRIHNRGITLVMATHDMNLAYSWADWILVMDQGQCVMEGTPDDIFKDSKAIIGLGLDRPMLLDLWEALPEASRQGISAPKNVSDFKTLLQKVYL
ncbi:energy-coupling factor ABC transporter ATP-binding protein [Paenibacillus sp. Soil724D2]|uniref:energy-coupling factor ABC transporter ATP-binding protein n=1 Tax=Paenibacillus sp. (strain Soil724D2) TaxID=1736392 RepID=UPI0007158625|nr:ABC transporter ATP-binding protein [Paenibacillus sp. Soil724D2]KRE48694.1 cobalt ABC transporter ATP-binding protein [Paenibacillus sp. Soil724D2]